MHNNIFCQVYWVRIEIHVWQFQVFKFTSGYDAGLFHPCFFAFFLAISISIFNIFKYYFCTSNILEKENELIFHLVRFLDRVNVSAKFHKNLKGFDFYLQIWHGITHMLCVSVICIDWSNYSFTIVNIQNV